MSQPPRLAAGAVDRLLVNSEPWLSCDDCFELVDAVIDAVISDRAGMATEFRVHLGACGVCEEEALALAELAAGHHGISTRTALERFRAAMEPPKPGPIV